MSPRTRIQLTALPTPSSYLFGIPRLSPLVCLQTRSYASPAQKKPPSNKKHKAARSHFAVTDLSAVDQFSLVDAMRYIRAMEVGRDPVATKYELHVKLRTQKSGPTIKSRIRLPKPVKTDMRICVIAEGKQAEAARQMGAVLVGTEEVFEKVQSTAHTYAGEIGMKGNFTLTRWS
jgi:large subunit ribosomal protein L1